MWKKYLWDNQNRKRALGVRWYEGIITNFVKSDRCIVVLLKEKSSSSKHKCWSSYRWNKPGICFKIIWLNKANSWWIEKKQTGKMYVITEIGWQIMGHNFFFLAESSGLWDLSSLARDWIPSLCSESAVLTTGPLGNFQVHHTISFTFVH